MISVLVVLVALSTAVVVPPIKALEKEAINLEIPRSWGEKFSDYVLEVPRTTVRTFLLLSSKLPDTTSECPSLLFYNNGRKTLLDFCMEKALSMCLEMLILPLIVP